jgi:hypothetical protein
MKDGTNQIMRGHQIMQPSDSRREPSYNCCGVLCIAIIRFGCKSNGSGIVHIQGASCQKRIANT